MLPRFCKLCYEVVDESVLRYRRFSVRHLRKTETYENDDHEHEQQIFDNEESEVKTKKKKRTCIIKCKNSDFDFYKGDTYPKFKPIPLASRGWHHRNSRDDYFTIFPTDTFTEQQVDTGISFRDLNINEELINNLENNEIINPTSIQKLAIPKLLKGENAILTAETGSGKTYAYLLPLLQQILEWKSLKPDRGYNKPLGIILSPSRELADQISYVAKKLTKNLGIKIATLTGGRTKQMMFNPPVREIDLLVATTGVIKKLSAVGVYKMEEVRHVVLDEADTLFDKSFSELIVKILSKIPIVAERKYSEEGYPITAQLTLNSATIPQNLRDTLHTIIDPDSIEPIVTGSQHLVNVAQKFWRLSGSQKPMTLLKLIKPKAKSKIPVIIFSNTSATCDFTKLFLEQFNINVINLHGDMPFKLRRGKFMEFQSGKSTVLTTTDAGARGLDTVIAKDVINFDFPLITSEYIHRCGRTGRIGSPKDCRIINFISRPLEIILTRKIEFATRKMKPIPMVDMIHNKDEEDEFLTYTPTDNDTHEKDLVDFEDSDTEISYKIPN